MYYIFFGGMLTIGSYFLGRYDANRINAKRLKRKKIKDAEWLKKCQDIKIES
jgi:hypothetical protein